MKNSVHLGSHLIGGIAAGIVALTAFNANANAADYKLVENGKLTVAFNGDMPGTSLEGDKLIGVDGEIMQLVAERMGLTVEPALMEWSAEIASVKSGRVDIMHGMMGWRESRAEVMSLSDPIYYFRATIAQKEDSDMCKLSELENKSVATITGFSWVDELKSIPGLKLKLYDTSDAAMRDLVTGRVDALLADPPLVQYAITQNPDWGVHQKAFCEDENADYPQLTSAGNTIFAANIDNPELIDAVNETIAELWEDCSIRDIGAKYGLTDDHWFDPGPSNQRAGVDRPADWKQPNCANK
ncbi:MAG: ABC transporter substrate-binding protein [Granulosicoccaceae bacterium]